MPWLLPLSALVSLLFLWGSLRLRRRQRLLADMPTSKAAGVFIGLTEMQGTAECEAPRRSFLAGTPCVHYHYRVEEHWSRLVTVTTTDSKGRSRTTTKRESGWTEIASGGETVDFYVKDDTGIVLVRPEGAKIEPLDLFDETVSRGDPLYYAKGPAGAVANSDHRRRFTETGLPLHTPLFVVGQARERADLVAAEIASDPEAELFLISARSEEKVQSGYALWSWLCLVLGLLCVLGGLIAYQNQQGTPSAIGPLVAMSTGYLAAFALGWVWMVYNSLVGLRERTRQGWSLVDVQLKRRHDLIPGLVAACTGLAAHEAATQAALAALRAQQQATPPGEAGADFAGLARSLRGVIERHPDLMAQASFARLHEELVATEQRVALARAYYNDIATAYATRLECVPDRWVARIGRMRPAALLAAADFERATVNVHLA
ncbi:LemA domain-containing protein [Oleiharenicola lentus]|uniref:RING-type E3 ubiquitin transferase n=1 Tax=Oleiharenicola lentus TaxID=2508720 RepID=A0A4Q1C8L1_9BACT|nr:LemA family protein [Oleiharenicola lentus]RXK55238.1 LemA domain-containing protein [Oleiharenicola lentus]